MKALLPKPEVSAASSASPVAVRHVSVTEDSGEGQRLDNFLLRELPGVPKSHLYRLIRSGQVRVNGARTQPEARLGVGDSVRVPPVRTAEPARAWPPAPALEPEILFEDDALLVLDKPAGLAVHGGSGVAHGVIERLRSARPEAPFLELVHRLDRDTSGVLMVAKRRPALVALHRQLRDRVTYKEYRAIVVGRFPFRTRTFSDPLERYLTPEGERRVRIRPDGQSALSRVTGLARVSIPGVGELTLVGVRIETGRTHQIRVHLAGAGFPIAGDEKYGDFALNRVLTGKGFKSMYLHAFALRIRHPIDGRPLAFEAPLPPAFDRLMSAGPQVRPDRGDAAASSTAP